jgi:hypothetical protein
LLVRGPTPNSVDKRINFLSIAVSYRVEQVFQISTGVFEVILSLFEVVYDLLAGHFSTLILSLVKNALSAVKRAFGARRAGAINTTL